MSKVFAWLLFISSVVCFVMSFRTQQIAADTERMNEELVRPMGHHGDLWQVADTSEVADQ